MTSLQIFGLQVVLSFVVYGLIAKWYVSPRLEGLPLPIALQPLLVPHTLRHLGLIFLVPSLVGPGLPTSFAVPAAYGTFLAGLLALAAIFALRARSPLGIPLVWIFSIVGLGDLVNAFYQALSADVSPEQFGVAYFIPTFVVPAAVVTHLMVVHLLLRRSSDRGGPGTTTERLQHLLTDADWDPVALAGRARGFSFQTTGCMMNGAVGVLTGPGICLPSRACSLADLGSSTRTQGNCVDWVPSRGGVGMVYPVTSPWSCWPTAFWRWKDGGGAGGAPGCRVGVAAGPGAVVDG